MHRIKDIINHMYCNLHFLKSHIMELLTQIFSFTTVKCIPATQGDMCSQDVYSCCLQ